MPCPLQRASNPGDNLAGFLCPLPNLGTGCLTWGVRSTYSESVERGSEATVCGLGALFRNGADPFAVESVLPFPLSERSTPAGHLPSHNEAMRDPLLASCGRPQPLAGSTLDPWGPSKRRAKSLNPPGPPTCRPLLSCDHSSRPPLRPLSSFPLFAGRVAGGFTLFSILLIVCCVLSRTRTASSSVFLFS